MSAPGSVSRMPPIVVIDAWTSVGEPSPKRGRGGPRDAAPNAGLLSLLGSRLVSLVLSLVVAALVLWSARSTEPVDSQATLLLAGARVAGLIGGVLLFGQIVLMSRLGWLDRRIPTFDLHVLHREMGGC